MKLSEAYPLLSSLSLGEMTPNQYRSHIKQLLEEQVSFMAAVKERRKSKGSKSSGPVPGISYRVNKKGTPIITCRREKKELTAAEVAILAKHHKVSVRELWNLCLSKGYEITRPEIIIGGADAIKEG